MSLTKGTEKSEMEDISTNNEAGADRDLKLIRLEVISPFKNPEQETVGPSSSL